MRNYNVYLVAIVNSSTRDVTRRSPMAGTTSVGSRLNQIVSLQESHIWPSSAKRIGFQSRSSSSIPSGSAIPSCAASAIRRMPVCYPIACASRSTPSSICSGVMPENDRRANSWPPPSTKNALPMHEADLLLRARDRTARDRQRPAAARSTGRSRRAARSISRGRRRCACERLLHHRPLGLVVRAQRRARCDRPRRRSSAPWTIALIEDAAADVGGLLGRARPSARSPAAPPSTPRGSPAPASSRSCRGRSRARRYRRP